VFPQLNEMLFTLMTLLADDVAAQAVQVVPALSVALLVASWAARIGGRSSGPWAAALWLGNPLVVWMAGQAYVDLGLTLFAIAGMVCLERFRLDRERAFLWLGGALLGAACGVKYLGLFVLVLGIAHVFGSGPPGRRTRSACIVLVAAAAIAAPWYVRNAWETGNPVFPYFHDLFGSVDWWNAGSSERVEAPRDDGDELPGTIGQRLLGMVRGSPAWLVTLPVTVTWGRELFGRQAPHTPWTLLLVLAIAWSARRDRQLLWLLVGTAVYAALLLYTTHRDLRFLLPAAATLSAGGAVALRPAIAAGVRLGRRLGRRLARRGAALVPLLRRRAVETAVVAAFLSPGAIYGAYKLWERGPLPIGAEEREQFLSRWVPAYRAITFLDRRHGDGEYTVYGLGFGPVRYYARGRYLGDRYGVYGWGPVWSWQQRPVDVHDVLRRWGVDYLLTSAPGVAAQPARWEPCFSIVYLDEEAALMGLARSEAECPKALP
jgi:4-amino-4-deoxy-L-arabinose transferase-like glycosyltransferase